jgi:DNA polymerase-4
MKGSHIRLIGISATNLDHGEYRQMSLFDLPSKQKTALPVRKMTLEKAISPEKEQRLDAMTDKIRSEFGKKAIQRGSELKHQK